VPRPARPHRPALARPPLVRIAAADADGAAAYARHRDALAALVPR
jgi:hypothetical protein